MFQSSPSRLPKLSLRAVGLNSLTILHSPDMVSSDYYLLAHLKNAPRGSGSVNDHFNSKPAPDFYKGIKVLIKRRRKRVETKKCYIDK